jgi:lysophospholipase L1-like esterase
MSLKRLPTTLGLLTVAALTTLTSAPVRAQNSAVIPAPFQEERHDAFLAEARGGDIDCLLMGDSITDWWARAGIDVYEENFGGLNCANFGIAGDRTQGVLWRMENGELEGYSPKLMMLMIGTNNLSGRRSAPNTPEEISMGIATIVTKFRTTFPEARVLLLAGLDDGEYVRFMDIGDRFLESDGSISPEVMPDALHPSPLGYEIWADAVMPTFIEMLTAS